MITLSGRRQWPGVDFGENSQILRRASNRAETGGSFGEQGGKPANPAGLPMVLLSCVEASVGNGSRRFWRRERNFRSDAGLAHKLTLWQKQSCEHARAGDGETLARNTRLTENQLSGNLAK